MQIAIIHNQQTMSSHDLLDLINQARVQAGESEVRRNDFMARCRDELEGEHYESFVVTNPNGTQSEGFRLTKDQCMLVAMRESKVVRRKVLETLNSFEAKQSAALPNFADPAEAAIAWAEQYRARQLAEQTKAQIGARREATAMATASAAVRKANSLEIQLDKAKQYASIKRMEMLYHGQQFSWRLLKSTSAEMAMPPIDIFDANYGTVKAYHADVWMEAYAVEIIATEAA